MQRVAVDDAQRLSLPCCRLSQPRDVRARTRRGARLDWLASWIDGQAGSSSARVAIVHAALLVVMASSLAACRDRVGTPLAEPLTIASPTAESSVAAIVASPSSIEDLDRAFIDAMVPHHQSSIDVARLAEKQASRPELAELARAVVERQQRETDQLIRWRRDWYGNVD